jgi:sulfur carrier protein ThiS adenylyltransferase
MKIRVNECDAEVEAGAHLLSVKSRFKPDADVVICNGAAMSTDYPLSEGDQVVLIRRGERPRADELEALLVARHTPGVHAKVKRAVVGIAGLGGLGSAIAVALARVGVGRLELADFDVVEPSNLNRQQYFIRQIGAPKTEALAENLREINPYVSLGTHQVRLTADNVAGIFAGVNVLVEAFDTPGAKAELVDGFSRAYPARPIVMASGLAGYGPGSAMRVHRLGTYLYVVGDLETAARPGTGLMAPRVGIAAHLQANVVLRLLLGEEGD